MGRARKRERTCVRAFQLGENNSLELELISKKLLKKTGDGKYEVITSETRLGSGEIVSSGDYIKYDSEGNIYPNLREWFEYNQVKVGENRHLQISKPLLLWTADEKMIPEIQYLLDRGLLEIDEGDEGNYFQAQLWGTLLSASKDSFIVFYNVESDDSGKIRDVDFNFVAKAVFEATYEVIGQD